MTLTRIEVFELAVPVQRPRGPAPITYQRRQCVLVRIEDQSGMVGWGETYARPGVAAVLADLAGALEGKDASLTRPLLDELAARTSDHWAVSAMAIALDDLRARAANVPISTLYGGRRRHAVRAYASSGGYLDDVGPEQSWADDVAAAVEAGFTACKVRIGRFPPSRELPILHRLREETDPGVELMVDANGAYSLPRAVEVGRALEQWGYRWFEEPLIRTRGGLSYAGYEQLTAALAIPIAAGEGLETRGAFDAFLARHAADIVQPDVSICGGIGEALFIGELAALHACPCVPHAWGGAVTLAATLQLLSLLPEPSEVSGIDAPLLEYDTFENPMRTAVLGAIALQNGYIAVPDGPGLGVTIDEQWVRRTAARR